MPGDPASTRIRSRSIPNVDTDRLRRRLAWLIEHRGEIAKSADGRPPLRRFAKEFHLIEREIARRSEEAPDER